MKNAKSFVERLTRKQIEQFAEKLYPNVHHAIMLSPSDSSYDKIKIVFHTKRFGFFSHIFTDFSAGINDPRLWTNYLYEIFGEEYKDAFTDYYFSMKNE